MTVAFVTLFLLQKPNGYPNFHGRPLIFSGHVSVMHLTLYINELNSSTFPAVQRYSHVLTKFPRNNFKISSFFAHNIFCGNFDLSMKLFSILKFFQRESRSYRFKSCHRMQQPMAYFENTAS